MRQIIMTVHHEGDAWWADSPSLPGFYAAGDSLEDLRDQIREGVAFALDDASHAIIETSTGEWTPWAEASSWGQSATSAVREFFGFEPQSRPNARPKTNARLAFT